MKLASINITLLGNRTKFYSAIFGLSQNMFCLPRDNVKRMDKIHFLPLGQILKNCFFPGMAVGLQAIPSDMGNFKIIMTFHHTVSERHHFPFDKIEALMFAKLIT